MVIFLEHQVYLKAQRYNKLFIQLEITDLRLKLNPGSIVDAFYLSAVVAPVSYFSEKRKKKWGLT